MDILNILLEKEGTGLTAEETAAATEYGLAQIRNYLKLVRYCYYL